MPAATTVMASFTIRSITLLLLFLSLFTSVFADIVDEDVARANAIVDWVRSKGGFFSHKLEMRRTDIEDVTSFVGVFAKENISKGERLLHVPQSCYISLGDEAAEIDHEDEEMAIYLYNVCRLSHKLAAELKLGNESDYAPFIDYVQHQQRGQLPATWSKEGKDLLRRVQAPTGKNLVDWQENLFSDCNPFDSHILALTVQRGYDEALIPLWDMFNHRNGRHLNTENTPMYANDGLQVYARNDISKGQEVYTTYDECADSGYLKWYWGTPEILKDFGFVEQYQRRWAFRKELVWFQIDENNEGELEVKWDTEGEEYGMPKEEGVEFIREELERLQQVGEDELKEQREVPDHEWNVIQQFHQASVTAFSMAIESAEAFLAQQEENEF